MTCVECGAVADDRSAGWQALDWGLPPEAEPEDPGSAGVPAAVTFCRSCSIGEFGSGSDW
jgi:hypothetical protein